MTEYLLGHFSYWLTTVLLCIGLYGVMFKKNLIKKLIGLTILQSSVVLFWVSIGTKEGATIPIKRHAEKTIEVASYHNPLPHTLMLTAIVVGVATMGVAFALLIATYNRYGTLNEDEILNEIQ